MFKVLRMKRVEMKEENFTPRKEEKSGGHPVPPTDFSSGEKPGEKEVFEKEKASVIEEPSGAEREPQHSSVEEIELLIDRKEAWRVYDRFEEEEITVLPDGSFRIRMCCLTDDWVYGMILSFGPSARVLGSERVRREIIRRIEEMGRNYNS